ncbi:MAG: long-chain fatty acid--CoA ligase [Alphaproteobacteria bacterium]|nr:long-chain fatty acid--CoA ligase [Alphaproteobacteria bacterium]
MGLLDTLRTRRDGRTPIIIAEGARLCLDDLAGDTPADLADVAPGDVVALIGDYDAPTLGRLLHLIDRGAIVVPLTEDTASIRDELLESAHADLVLSRSGLRRIGPRRAHPLLDRLRAEGGAGLVFFSSGTTGRPKAILHDAGRVLRKFAQPRPAWRTLSFLLFDHFGGFNTLFHTLFNGGVIVRPRDRSADAVVRAVADHRVELLPTTPTFLRMLLLSGLAGSSGLCGLRLVTYGTERMDQGTLSLLCEMMPHTEFRQTYGVSELGVFSVRSRARDSLFIQVGGPGIETRVNARDCLEIRSEGRMLGYLNAPAPFDADGWYDTSDHVERDGDWLRIVGRSSDLISVGGEKIFPEEIERRLLAHPAVAQVKAMGRPNPVTGEHIEVIVEPRAGAELSREELRHYCREMLPRAMQPHRIRIGAVAIGHRFKRL